MIELIKRVLVAVVFIPLILWTLYTGGWALFGFLTVVASIQLWEVKSLFGKEIKLNNEIIPVGLIIFSLTAKVGIEYAVYALCLYGIFFMSRESFQVIGDSDIIVASISLFRSSFAKGSKEGFPSNTRWFSSPLRP